MTPIPASGNRHGNAATGKTAENQALTFLTKKKLKLIERNYRCRGGEIDLIMEDNSVLVFVEVRYRKTDKYGSALESVDTRKQARLIACASQYLTHHHINKPTRFDVVAMFPTEGILAIEWVQDAFRV